MISQRAPNFRKAKTIGPPLYPSIAKENNWSVVMMSIRRGRATRGQACKLQFAHSKRDRVPLCLNRALKLRLDRVTSLLPLHRGRYCA